jgi:hypothetical protein
MGAAGEAQERFGFEFAERDSARSRKCAGPQRPLPACNVNAGMSLLLFEAEKL